MATPRNNLQVGNDYPEVLACIDTVYEIADAEFNSDKSIHHIWNQLNNRHDEFRRSFARTIQPFVEKIAVREGLYIHRHGAQVIANQIAEDWLNTYDKENTNGMHTLQ